MIESERRESTYEGGGERREVRAHKREEGQVLVTFLDI